MTLRQAIASSRIDANGLNRPPCVRVAGASASGDAQAISSTAETSLSIPAATGAIHGPSM